VSVAITRQLAQGACAFGGEPDRAVQGQLSQGALSFTGYSGRQAKHGTPPAVWELESQRQSRAISKDVDVRNIEIGRDSCFLELIQWLDLGMKDSNILLLSIFFEDQVNLRETLFEVLLDWLNNQARFAYINSLRYQCLNLQLKAECVIPVAANPSACTYNFQ
jgi:hypothetical protein